MGSIILPWVRPGRDMEHSYIIPGDPEPRGAPAIWCRMSRCANEVETSSWLMSTMDRSVWRSRGIREVERARVRVLKALDQRRLAALIEVERRGDNCQCDHGYPGGCGCGRTMQEVAMDAICPTPTEYGSCDVCPTCVAVRRPSV